MRRTAAFGFALVLGFGTAVVAGGPAEAAAPKKLMIVGDSISQGFEGDWTWRYRLWDNLRGQNVPVDFVGPYKGTATNDPPAAPKPPPVVGAPGAPDTGPKVSGEYAGHTVFDSDHFAVWGRAVAQDKDQIKDQVAAFQPDVLLVELGFNDIGWYISDPDGTLVSMKSFVDQARAAKPNVKFVLGNVVHRTPIDGRPELPGQISDYNQKLAAAIPQWSTTQSPIKLADIDSLYTPATDTYDGLHPNVRGEYAIAEAFEKTLASGFRIGSRPTPTPAAPPEKTVALPANVTATTSPGGVAVTWDKSFGAHGYFVDYRDATANEGWQRTTVLTERFDKDWTTDGHRYEFKVTAQSGDAIVSPTSAVVSAVAHPQTAAGPAALSIRSTPGKDFIDVTWDAPTGPYSDSVIEYGVWLTDKTAGGWPNITYYTGRSARIGGLTPGHQYGVGVLTWNAAGGGQPVFGRDVIPGLGAPAAPTLTKVTTTSPVTVELEWTAVPNTTGYRVWARDVESGGVLQAGDDVVTVTHKGIGFLFPGAQRYEFCITATNGTLDSAKSNCLRAPAP